jgi:hypothetical protein
VVPSPVRYIENCTAGTHKTSCDWVFKTALREILLALLLGKLNLETKKRLTETLHKTKTLLA